MKRKPGAKTKLNQIRDHVEAILAGKVKYDNRRARSHAREIRRWVNNGGACYEVAINLVLLSRYDAALAGAKLAHGIICHSSGMPIVHAWVEVGRVCVDPTKSPDHPNRVAPRRYYSVEEATENLRRTGHSGPWEPCFAALQRWCEAVWAMLIRNKIWKPWMENESPPPPDVGKRPRSTTDQRRCRAARRASQASARRLAGR
ncbi:MAG: hypothetical protein ACYSVY_27155 [Planctomycetota bacterium]